MEKRIRELIDKMTIEEKASQLLHESAAIPRLNIPEYDWWSEALHGVARAGIATVFPQAIAMAATFDDSLVEKVASAISSEARAKYNLASTKGNRSRYHGLTFWTPNVNIFRDPRWGRGQETYGEDPFLTSKMGVAFVKGLQGDHPDRMKVAACAKHYAVHSGPEELRHVFDAKVSRQDLWETYLPAFEALVKAGVESVMGAYNRTLGEPCCGSQLLMKDILRGRWGFKGHYVSDCWAIKDFHEFHKVTSSPTESVALALSMGCDLNCGCTYQFVLAAVKEGLITEEQIDLSLSRLLATKFKLGMFDEPGSGPYDELGAETIRAAEHIQLAREVAEKSVVLLRNQNNLLPLNDEPKKILLIGPGATNIHTLLGNYHGLSPQLVTVLEGVTAKLKDKPQISLDYTQGCMMYSENLNTGWTIGMAEMADVVIAVFGLDTAMEGEEGDAIAAAYKGDRKAIELPQWQLKYLKAMKERGTPIVLVLTGGSPIAIPEDLADAVLMTWYSGEQGGAAIADIIFGDVVPSGKLPLTFPKSTSQLPPYEDYAMKGRTYRYMNEEPLYPFGFGLSYTRFSISNMKMSASSVTENSKLSMSCVLSNEGSCKADETLQLYVARDKPGDGDPLLTLRAFQRVCLKAGESKTVNFDLSARDFMFVNAKGEKALEPGTYRVIIGNSSPMASAEARGAMKALEHRVSV
ncbi:MAG: glycoside hydrolase family 3 C-terminal domain-containing protein [Spirochaetales bacterium]|nr:glycoside hydrolase family 3 C-terminal domain-containing protein [Spirochaetales bacterium]